MVFRILVHAAITYVVLRSSGAFSLTIFYVLAVLGMLYSNYVNVQRLLMLTRKPKVHAA